MRLSDAVEDRDGLVAVHDVGQLALHELGQHPAPTVGGATPTIVTPAAGKGAPAGQYNALYTLSFWPYTRTYWINIDILCIYRNFRTVACFTCYRANFYSSIINFWNFHFE